VRVSLPLDRALIDVGDPVVVLVAILFEVEPLIVPMPQPQPQPPSERCHERCRQDPRGHAVVARRAGTERHVAHQQWHREPDARQKADTEDIDAPVLLRSSPLTFIDSVLLLYLRQQLAEADARGNRAVVADTEMAEALAIYEKNLSTDRAGFNRRVAAAVQKMKENHILTRLAGQDDRHEVSPALKLLFSAEDVSALSNVYRQLRDTPAAKA